MIVQFSAGMLVGVLFGFAFGFARFLVLVAIGLAALGALVILLTGGVDGLVIVLSSLATGVTQHEAFFAALALGNLFSVTLLMR